MGLLLAGDETCDVYGEDTCDADTRSEYGKLVNFLLVELRTDTKLVLKRALELDITEP
jgi:hypothetical protein